MSFWLDWAVHKPLKINFTPRNRSRTDGIILHVAASEAASLHGWFSNPKAAASSHLYVRRDGTVEQYVDLDQISWASVRGDLRCISVDGLSSRSRRLPVLCGRRRRGTAIRCGLWARRRRRSVAWGGMRLACPRHGHRSRRA